MSGLHQGASLPSGEALRLRPPELLMTPERLSAQKPMRLSFVRLLLSRMIAERWETRQVSAQLDPRGVGVLMYETTTPTRTLHTLILSDSIPKEMQSDRAVGTRWDMTVGVSERCFDDAAVARFAAAPPRDGGSGADLRLGRVDEGFLLIVCANRSNRVFDHAVEALATGQQPNVVDLGQVGYLLRGINYIANGMMGTRMFDSMEVDHPLKGPYFAQMFGCYLVREAGFDVVNAIARHRSRGSVELCQSIRRHIGVGNSTGVGLGLMVNRHPILINQWITLRETALAYARQSEPIDCAKNSKRLLALLDRATIYLREDRTDNGFFMPSSAIAYDLTCALGLVREFDMQSTMDGLRHHQPWDYLAETVEATGHMESAETLNSILVELRPEVAARLAPLQIIKETYGLSPEMPTRVLLEIVESEYEWALRIDLAQESAYYWMWYRTAIGGEPRMTRRGAAGDAALRNVALDIPGEVQELRRALRAAVPGADVADLLNRRPDLRATVERVQSVAGLPYHSPHMNMFDRDFVPINLGRFVLWALKGLEKPSPKNNIWIRGVLLQGAPTALEVGAGTTDDWIFPRLPQQK